MTFVSFAFLIFLGVVFSVYHLFPRVRFQNILIVVSSFFFYGYWDWRFLTLLTAMATVTYLAAIFIEMTPSLFWRKIILWGTVTLALSVLGFFKYFDFFLDSGVQLIQAMGLSAHAFSLNIILPLGISFMTFQGLAYVIDVYRGEHPADRNFVRVLAFKSFFPQLVAGPIERAGHLLDQFKRPRELTQAKVDQAAWLLLYGYLMKVVVADSMAPIVDSQFVVEQSSGWSVALATICFGIQIYADFAGYSLIAKGTALLFGFDLIWNFRFPYWSTSISDFWRRWHISLSNWLRDYLYIPLGGNRAGPAMAARNMLITMGLGGLWHGASWNFVLWGVLHGVALGLWRYSGVPTVFSSVMGRFAGWLMTMLVVFVGWFLFRANSWPVMDAMLLAMDDWTWMPVHHDMVQAILTVALPLLLLEWVLLRWGDFALLAIPRTLSIPVYSVVVTIILTMAGTYQASFIYFQF